MCPAWQENSDNKKNADSEVTKFEESQEFQNMLSDVSIKLGFKFTLSIKQVKTIWDMCRYDLAWNLDAPSGWCVVSGKPQKQFTFIIKPNFNPPTGIFTRTSCPSRVQPRHKVLHGQWLRIQIE